MEFEDWKHMPPRRRRYPDVRFMNRAYSESKFTEDFRKSRAAETMLFYILCMDNNLSKYTSKPYEMSDALYEKFRKHILLNCKMKPIDITAYDRPVTPAMKEFINSVWEKHNERRKDGDT